MSVAGYLCETPVIGACVGPSADQAAAVAPAKALDALRCHLEAGLPPLLARHLALVDVLAADAMSSGAAGQVWPL